MEGFSVLLFSSENKTLPIHVVAEAKNKLLRTMYNSEYVRAKYLAERPQDPTGPKEKMPFDFFSSVGPRGLFFVVGTTVEQQFSILHPGVDNHKIKNHGSFPR
jgi:hypothetical protein